MRFFDQYRSYVINYNLGKDLVRALRRARGGTADTPTAAGPSSAIPALSAVLVRPGLVALPHVV